MSKRKQAHEMGVEGDDENGSEEQTVDVNFDYYNVNANIDYHTIQRLLIQLFGPDAERVQTGPLADLVTSVAQESGVGSTIKTEEDEEAEPYAFLTVVSCHDHPGLQRVIDYVLSKTTVDQGFHETLSSLLQSYPQCHVGLVLGERVVNMPVQVMPPMYRMLSEEIDGAIEDGYRFTHYLFLSRAYSLSTEEEEAMLTAQRNSKRHRSETKQKKGSVYAFHPEDEEIMHHAMHTVTYTFTDAPPRDSDSVGVDLRGRAMLVATEKLQSLVNEIEETYAVMS